MIQPAERLSLVQEYYFSRKLKEVAQLNAEGKDIISLAIGSPDMPPSKQTIDKLCEVAQQPNAHGYQPTQGTPELREAMSAFYKRWYGVDLDAKSEVLPLIGSKEGILHVTLAFVNPGDEVLVPNPGYPTYTSLSKILGAKIVNYDLREDNGWQPDFDELEKMDLSKVKLMWTNYPNMPTGGRAQMATYERLVKFAKDHDIVVVPAALADFTPDKKVEGKIPSDKGFDMKMNPVPKVLPILRTKCDKVIGYKAESGLSRDALVAKARARLEQYDLSAVIANDIDSAGKTSANVLLVTKEKATDITGSKPAISEVILNYVSEKL